MEELYRTVKIGMDTLLSSPIVKTMLLNAFANTAKEKPLNPFLNRESKELMVLEHVYGATMLLEEDYLFNSFLFAITNI